MDLVSGDSQQIEKLGYGILRATSEKMDNAQSFSAEDLKSRNEFSDRFASEISNLKNTSSEDLTFSTNPGVYTTVVADFIEQKLRPQLVAAGVIKRLSWDPKGASSVKIPVGDLLTALPLPDSGTVTYAGNPYSSVDVPLTWQYSANKITMALIEQSNVDLIQDQLGELGDAIARKIDSDIIAAFDAAITVGTNGTNLGVGTTITYPTLIDGIAGAGSNFASPDVILTNWSTWANLMNDVDIKTGLANNSVTLGTNFPMIQTLFGKRLIISDQVPAGKLFLVDSQRTGYYIEASAVKVFNDRVSGALANEVIAAKLYGVGVAQPNALFRINENLA